MTSREMLELAKQEAVRRGYRIDTDAEGTVRLIRPDGTTAVTARVSVTTAESKSEQ